jgi:hypothetical protein
LEEEAGAAGEQEEHSSTSTGEGGGRRAPLSLEAAEEEATEAAAHPFLPSAEVGAGAEGEHFFRGPGGQGVGEEPSRRAEGVEVAHRSTWEVVAVEGERGTAAEEAPQSATVQMALHCSMPQPWVEKDGCRDARKH